MFDVGFTKENCWFRLRAAGIIIEDGCVLFCKTDNVDYYYSIGGGIHHGEKSQDAVLREVFEETGIEYEIDRLAFIHENFFKGEQEDDLNGMRCHEVTFYYLMKSRGTRKLNSKSYAHGRREHMHWLPINKLSEYTAFPTFFADKLGNLGDSVEHIVTIKE